MTTCVLHDFPSVGARSAIFYSDDRVQGRLFVSWIYLHNGEYKPVALVFMLSHIDADKNPNYVQVGKVFHQS